MTAESIIGDWKKNKFRPVYWLEGEETFYIDKIVNYAEEHLLPAAEASFNLCIFYGKDAQWPDIVNACMRYPMFSEKQVVILKEAQQMRDIDKLENYINRPLGSTIFIVAYKEKKVDGRSKLAKVLKEKGELFSTKKMNDNHLPKWTIDNVKSKGLNIQEKAVALLVDHVGNDLARLDNEIEKIRVNLGDRTTITEDDIEKYIGISKEFNVFELQNAFAYKDFSKAIRIIQYFEANPKAGPIQLILPTLYSLFSKTMTVFGQKGNDEKSIAAAIGVSPFFIRDYLSAARAYGFEGIERALLLLHNYNLRSVGIEEAGASHASLLKEMTVKIMMPEQ